MQCREGENKEQDDNAAAAAAVFFDFCFVSCAPLFPPSPALGIPCVCDKEKMYLYYRCKSLQCRPFCLFVTRPRSTRRLPYHHRTLTHMCTHLPRPLDSSARMMRFFSPTKSACIYVLACLVRAGDAGQGGQEIYIRAVRRIMRQLRVEVVHRMNHNRMNSV